MVIKNRRCNIAILLHSLDRGGAERVATLLSRYFFEKGYGVYLFVNKLNRDTDYPYWGTTIEVPKLQYKELLIFGGKTARLISLKQKAKAIRQLKKKYHIDYSISFMDEYNLLNVMSRYQDKTYLRICDVMSVSGVAKANGWDFAPHIIGHYYNQATRVIVVNEAEKQDLVENYFVCPEKFQKIINPIRPMEFMTADREWRFGSQAVICVGRITEVKQQHHLVRVFTKVHQECPEARLVFVGSGESKYFQYVRRITIELGLGNVVSFEGRQTGVGGYLKNGKVFVSASRTEGYPNCLLEALTAGLPVVAADGVGGVGEILNDRGDYRKPDGRAMECKYGILTPQLDGKYYAADEPLSQEEEIFAQSVIDMLSDERLQQKYQGVAIDFIKANDLSTIGKKWEEMFVYEK